jgi:hypothetical protein
MLLSDTYEPLVNEEREFLTHDQGDYAMKYTDYMPAYSITLPAPVSVSEGDNLQVLTLNTPVLPEGEYLVTLSLVASFTSKSDQLHYHFEGENGVGPMLVIEAVDDGEVLPITYTLPFPFGGGSSTTSMHVSITGPGSADVWVVGGSITIVRIS